MMFNYFIIAAAAATVAAAAFDCTNFLQFREDDICGMPESITVHTLYVKLSREYTI